MPGEHYATGLPSASTSRKAARVVGRAQGECSVGAQHAPTRLAGTPGPCATHCSVLPAGALRTAARRAVMRDSLLCALSRLLRTTHSVRLRAWVPVDGHAARGTGAVLRDSFLAFYLS